MKCIKAIIFLLSVSMTTNIIGQNKNDIIKQFILIGDSVSLSKPNIRTGNLLVAYSDENSILDTTSSVLYLGQDSKKNRYYFSEKDSISAIGILLIDDGLNRGIYCGRYSIATIEEGEQVEVLRNRNCGFDVLSFNNCGFYNFIYSIDENWLSFVERRLFWPKRRKKINLSVGKL